MISKELLSEYRVPWFLWDPNPTLNIQHPVDTARINVRLLIEYMDGVDSLYISGSLGRLIVGYPTLIGEIFPGWTYCVENRTFGFDVLKEGVVCGNIVVDDRGGVLINFPQTPENPGSIVYNQAFREELTISTTISKLIMGLVK